MSQEQDGADPVREALLGYAQACGEALRQTGVTLRGEAVAASTKEVSLMLASWPGWRHGGPLLQYLLCYANRSFLTRL
jgi:hypothetical protein